MKNLLSKIRIIAFMTVVMIILSSRLVVHANENFTSDYTQTEYTEEDGFDSGEANCICQSASGYIWIGTDSGLYRYDGSEFGKFSMGDESDSSVYSIKSIISTDAGEVYVGTENYGLFEYSEGKFIRVTDTYDMGITTVNQMYQDEDGKIWLATSAGIYYISDDGIYAIEDEEVQNSYITAIGGYKSYIYAIADNETIINIKEERVISKIDKSEYTEEDLNSLYVDENGNRYIGTSGHSIIKLITNKNYSIISSGSISGINMIKEYEDKIWILADDGVAYINDEEACVNVTGLGFNDAMSDIICDYEGNYWFTSYRYGLTMLGKSKFCNATLKYGMDSSIVNCVTEYAGQLYVGTDEGLVIIDGDGNKVTDSELVTMLSGKSIRDLYIDSNNMLWVCTYRIYGVVRVNTRGEYKYFNKAESSLTSNSVNCIIELRDGSMAIGTENGISILKDGQVTVSYGRNSGMTNTDIVSLYQDDDGILYAGSNGSGMYSIDLNSNLKVISEADGLASNVVSAIIGGSNGIWIGTDNGLFYQEGAVRQISVVDSTNSISDLITDDDGNLWIFGSKGIQKYYESDLLSSVEPDVVSYTKSDGYISDITEKSTNYISEDGLVYVCCDEGLSILDENNVYVNEVAPKVRISSITVDDTEYSFSDLDGTITVPKDTNRIVIKFSVLSYVNRGDISVNYYLEGFEDEERVLTGSDYLEAEYTNLEGGNYTFVLYAVNSDGVESEQAMTFEVIKEYKFSETSIFAVMIAVIIIITAIIIVILVRYLFKLLTKKNQQVEELSKKNEEAEKSNQAKNDYVNYLSHEIRAPLNSILAVSELLLRNIDMRTEDEKNQISTVYGSSYEILGIVDGISRLSNLQDGTLEIIEKEYTVTDAIDDLSQQFKSMINRDLVDLKVSIEDDIPNGLIGDCEKVKELVTDIYQRAAKTTKEGYISINIDWRKALRAEEDEYDSIYLDFVISDTGIGVKEDRLDSFFDLDDSYDKSDIGNFDISIGLAIARQLIELMDGDAKVSGTYGAGTTIKFSVKQKVFDYSYVNYNAKRRKEIAFRNSTSRIWLPDVRILLADDSEVGLKVEKSLFETYELICDTSASGFEAIDKAMINQYDMIFVDTVMPVMDGSDTVKEIRSMDGEEYKKLPIIALSENNIDTDREDIIAQGFDEVLVKPLEVENVENIFRIFIPEEKIKEKTNDITKYISESRFRDDVKLLEDFIVVEDALKIIGGNFDTFNRFIASFRDNYEEETDKLEIYIEEDVRKYRSILHEIKSNSGNIGAYSIERKAANLESAINIGNMQYAVENTHELVIMLKNMFKNITLYLDKINHTDGQKKEYRDGPDRQLLKDIRKSLKEADVPSIKSSISLIDRYLYSEGDTEFLNALCMTIDAMDYEGASDIIDQYLNSV